MWKVYIIQHNLGREIYIGKTNDLDRRLKEHNSGRQTATHKKTGEWILIYAEDYRVKSDADRRELRLKSHGRAKQELIKRVQDSLL